MKRYIPLVTGILALGFEIIAFLALMEIPPFGKGDSDIIWGLPCFFLIVLGFSSSGILLAMALKNDTHPSGNLAIYGLALNSLSLAIPALLLLFSILRALL